MGPAATRRIDAGPPMFHLILSICLAAAPGSCGTALLPQGDAPTREACEAGAAAVAGAWLAARPDLTGGPPACRANADLPALELVEVAPGVHVRFGTSRPMEETPDGRIANLGVIVGDRGVAVIDAGVSRAEAQALHVAIRRLTDLPVAHLVLTHAHPDHALGAPVMAEAGARVWAHAALPTVLQARAEAYLALIARLYPPAEWIGTGIAMPDRVVAERARIDLGGRVLSLRAWPPAHSEADLTVLDEATGTLFSGDLLFRDLTPVVEGSLRGWLDWMAGDPARGARLIVPGHGPASPSWAAASGPQHRLLQALAARTRDAIARGLPLSEAVPDIAGALQPLGESWAGFPETVARDATVAYKELEWE